MSDEPLNFEEHRRRMADRELVPCPRCRKMILGTVVRCPECGVHFDGAAEDFSDSPGTPRGAKTWIIVVAVLLLLAMLLSLFGR